MFFEDYLVYHRGQDPATFDPWLVMAVIAGRTSHLTLGTTVTGLLARDPVKLAREALTLRDLSDGRVVLGVGLGDPNDRGAALNPLWDADRGRGDQMDERLDLLLGLLAGRVPVWVGGSSRGRGGRPAGGARRRRRALQAHRHRPVERLHRRGGRGPGGARSRRTARRPASRHPSTSPSVAGCRLPSVDDERAAVDAAARGGATWWLEFVRSGPDDDMLAAVRRGPVRATAAP